MVCWPGSLRGDKLAYGLGTARFKTAGGDFDDEIVKLTTMAIKNGFWHLDGAQGMARPARTEAP